MVRGPMIASLCALLLVFACGPKPPPEAPAKPPPPPASQPPPPKPSKARISFVDCRPADATVVVDDEERGTVDEVNMRGGVEVPFGVHRIVVKRRGFESYRVELSVGEKGERIAISLQRKKRRRP